MMAAAGYLGRTLRGPPRALQPERGFSLRASLLSSPLGWLALRFNSHDTPRSLTGMLLLHLLDALRVQQRGHSLEVFARLKLCFDFGDVGKLFFGLQQRFLQLIKMLELMFDQAGDEPAVVVGAFRRLRNLLNQFEFSFEHRCPHKSKTQQSSSDRKVLVSGVRKLFERFSRAVRFS